MEYFLGSLITLLCLFALNFKIKKDEPYRIQVPTFSQSRKYLLIKKYLISVPKARHSHTSQSTKNFAKNLIRGIVVEDDIYWIEDGRLVTANLVNGKIDENSKKVVDTHTMDKVELDRVMFIVEKLTEGDGNDSSNSGQQEF